MKDPTDFLSNGHCARQAQHSGSRAVKNWLRQPVNCDYAFSILISIVSGLKSCSFGQVRVPNSILARLK